AIKKNGTIFTRGAKRVSKILVVMAKLALTVLAARKTANGMYPIFVRIAAKKEKAQHSYYYKNRFHILLHCAGLSPCWLNL
uniref:hypothetical protein n=1 Tax=Bacteroides uniformis TaxID=820 RepID=UPI0040255CBC